jgi:hypothetical protein
MANKKIPNQMSPIQPSGPIKPATAPLNLRGTLLNAMTGYPLGGLTVQVYRLVPADTAAASSPAKGRTKAKPQPHQAATQAEPVRTLLGSASSTWDGNYLVKWIASPSVSQDLCLLANCREAHFIITVSDGTNQKPLFTGPPTSVSTTSIEMNLPITIPKQVLTKHNWADVGQRLQGGAPAKRAGQPGAVTIVRLSDLVQELLLSPSSKMLFKDWSLTLRQNALIELETAFLDPHGILSKIAPLPSWQQLRAPTGLDSYQKALGSGVNRTPAAQAFDEMRKKVGQFADLSAVDWVIEPTQFAKGIGSAVTSHQGDYFGSLPTPPNIVPIIPHPELGYRDYLRTQWTTVIMLYGQAPLSLQEAEQQLRNRLHQDFRTQDTSEVAANETLIPILTEILTAKSGSTFGFGIPAAQIPARGAATSRQYLDTLIGLSGVSAQELTLRYRINFARPDTAMSNAVWENIYALQGFFRDSFQSVVDPSHTAPDGLNEPIIPSLMQGRAPFFLEYDEWLLLQQPIPFENYFQIRQIFGITLSADNRNELQSLANQNGNQALHQFYLAALTLQDQLVKVYQYMDESEYTAALQTIAQIQQPLVDLLNSPIVSRVDVSGGFASRRAMPVHSLDDLQKLLTLWQVPDAGPLASQYVFDNQWIPFTLNALVCSLVYLGVFILPVISAQASLNLGDYPTAVRELGRSAFLLVGKGTASWVKAYRDRQTIESIYGWWNEFDLYVAGDLPYTVYTAKLPGYPSFSDDDSVGWISPLEEGLPDPEATASNTLIPGGIHPIEQRFFRLQMGAAMLEWADTLYRSDSDFDANLLPSVPTPLPTPSASILRARELYKGVYYLHGAVPPINPSWSGQQPGNFFGGTINPAQASQLGRAQLGFSQIEAGLNFFGYAEDMVPLLRYSTLKPAADLFAAEAKAVEQDLLNAFAQLETATIDNMKNSAMLKRANLQVQIAQQQVGIAQDQVQQAQIAIAQVNQQIQTVQQQIADHNSLFGAVGDLVDGLQNTMKNVPSSLTSGVAAGFQTEAGGALGQANAAALLGLPAEAWVMAGFAALPVIGIVTISSIANAQNQRQSQLSNLEGQTMPSAQAQLDIAQRSVTIANLNEQIAQVDAQLASQLIAFAQERYLSVEFWTYMVALFKRILRQYLDLATRMGWLAQRALSYEQNTEVKMIRMDYFPAPQQGVGGADQLQLDLADLEAQRLDGLRETIPVKYTLSLARDFPLQFAQLLTTGQCFFLTQELPLRWAYPGTYGYRVIAVTPRLSRFGASAPVRGLLSNNGISQISGGDGSMSPSYRPADALPISEFNLETTDMQIYGLPGGTLMQFEGSGIESLWKLEFSAAANTYGLRGLLDVLITFNLRAQYSPSLYQSQIQQMPTTVTKLVLVSASSQQLSGLADLQGKPNQATIAFDLTVIGLPPREQNRTVNNVFVFLVGAKNAGSVKASFVSATPAQTTPFVLTNGTAFSNAPPITDPQSNVALSPLNVVKGISVDQTLSLVIDKTQNSGVDFSAVQDVLLGVDYQADV